MAECSKCGSPFHGEAACPQARRRGRTSTWKTRRELGLGPDELPFKFRVSIDPQGDDAAEVSRKRALLRLNSQRIYTQMGCSVQALNSMRAAALWLARLAENMDDEDKAKCMPLLQSSEHMLSALDGLSNHMIQQAVGMEEIVEKERKHARAARVRLAKVVASRMKKENEFGIFRLGGNGMGIPLLGEGGMMEQFRVMMEATKKGKEGDAPESGG